MIGCTTSSTCRGTATRRGSPNGRRGTREEQAAPDAPADGEQAEATEGGGQEQTAE